MSAIVVVLLLHTAMSAQMAVGDGEDVTIPVGTNGVTVQLPEYVRIVTPAQDYQVQPLVAPPSGKQGGGAGAEKTTDVRVFLVRPKKASPAEQRVTFVMNENRSVTARFVPGTTGDDSFVSMRWSKRNTEYATKSRGWGQFLSAERTLLLAMLRDEHTLGRKVLAQPVVLPDYPALEIVLVRSYQAEGITGSVYTFTNRSNTTITVNQAVLAIGQPNRAVLAQMDHSELRSCKEDNSTDPRGTGCMSAVRIVSRAGRIGSLGLDSGASMPFVVRQDKDK